MTTASLPTGVHPVLRAAATAAARGMAIAREHHGRESLGAEVAMGADATPTTQIDRMVEDVILDAVMPLGVNVLSEESGWIDEGSALTLVLDPVDGSGNAAAGIPFSGFTAALAADSTAIEALTVWLDTGRHWWARTAEPTGWSTSRRTALGGAVVSMIRPKPDNTASWLAVAQRCARVRILGSSSLEAALVCTGAFDAFVDAGSDTHRIVDLAAAMVFAPAAGAVLVDAFDRRLEIDPDLTRRWSGIVAATADLADEIRSLIRPL